MKEMDEEFHRSFMLSMTKEGMRVFTIGDARPLLYESCEYIRQDVHNQEIMRLKKIINDLQLERDKYASLRADKVSFYGMFDNHTFKTYVGTIEEVIEQWRKDLEEDNSISLCPIIVSYGKKELRRVGPMVFNKDEDKLELWKKAACADKDIVRLSSQRRQI